MKVPVYFWVVLAAVIVLLWMSYGNYKSAQATTQNSTSKSFAGSTTDNGPITMAQLLDNANA